MDTSIFKDGLLIDLDISYWTASKKLRPEDLGLKDTDIADAYKLGKKMLIPETTIRAFRAIEGKARRLVEEASFKFPVGNARFIPKKMFVTVFNKLKKYQAQYMTLVDNLIVNYDKLREEMLPVYQQAAEIAYVNQMPATKEFGFEYDPVKEKADFIAAFLDRVSSFYPPAEELRAKFALAWNVYEIAMPKMREAEAEKVVLKEIERDTFEQEYRGQLQTKISTFVDDVVKVLRQETVDICTRVANNIKEGKAVKGKTLHSLKTFIDRFSEMNFVGDFSIQNQLQMLREKVLDAYPADAISDSAIIQEELKDRLKSIANAAANITDVSSVTGEYRAGVVRKVEWKF